jgi:hypothetical protein
MLVKGGIPPFTTKLNALTLIFNFSPIDSLFILVVSFDNLVVSFDYIVLYGQRERQMIRYRVYYILVGVE